MKNPIVVFQSMGLMSMLAVAFIVLKLCKVIAWSWWWVLAPLWGPPALGLAICVLAVILYVIAVYAVCPLLDKWINWRKGAEHRGKEKAKAKQKKRKEKRLAKVSSTPNS